jgi:nucleoside phosphorylase
MATAPTADEPGHLFGATGSHARVVVMTVTDKEMPVAREVFAACGELAEVAELAAYTSEQFAGEKHLPFVLVRASDRGNLSMVHDIQHWMFEFRPQAFLLVGTAGGIWRPTNAERTNWGGSRRGDVIVSEYVHFGDYRKVTAHGNLLRYHRLEQPANYLLTQARPLINEPADWHKWLGKTWEKAPRLPTATEEEIVVGEQLQDNPMDATQQFLMRTFDRASATEMESAGIAQALHSLRKPAAYAPMYLSLRGVSDLIWACGTDGPLTEDDVARAKVFDAQQCQQADGNSFLEAGKTSERASWSPRAAAAASAFALGLVERLVRRQMSTMLGHPAIPGFELKAVGASD